MWLTASGRRFYLSFHSSADWGDAMKSALLHLGCSEEYAERVQARLRRRSKAGMIFAAGVNAGGGPLMAVSPKECAMLLAHRLSKPRWQHDSASSRPWEVELRHLRLLLQQLGGLAS